MYCKNCGNYMDPNAAVCVKCGCAKGTGLSFCPNCGQTTVPGAAVCINCGVQLAAPANAKSKLTAACWRSSWALTVFTTSTWASPARLWLSC